MNTPLMILNVLVALAFSLLYMPVFIAMVHRWSGGDDYGHAFLIPLICGYIIWKERQRLAAIALTPNLAWGIPVMLAAGGMLALGQIGRVILLQHASLFVMVIGLILLLLGPRYLRALLLPVSYLLLMIPIFDEAIDQLNWPFQLLAAAISSWTLQSLGYAVFREAQYLQLPRITLEVADICSGIRYLISVVAIGLPLAYFTLRTWQRRLLLIAFGTVVAVLANSLRITLIGIWAYSGTVSVHGPFKLLQGVFVAWIGFVALFAGARLLSLGPEFLHPTSAHLPLPLEPAPQISSNRVSPP